MRSRKIYQVYAALESNERKSFGLYLVSPLFGLGHRLEELRAVLEEMVADPEEVDLDAETIWKLLPSTQTSFRANGFDKLCAELMNALNDFLALEEFRSRPVTIASHQLSAYVERNLDEFVPRIYENLRDKLGEDLEKDSAGLYAHLELSELYGEYVFRKPRMPRGEQLLEIDARLNAFFFAKKLEIASLVEVFNQNYSADLELPYTDLFERIVGEPEDKFPLLVRIQALAWMLSSTREDQFYWQLKDLLIEKTHNLARDQRRTLFHLLLFHCVVRINGGEEAFELEMDELQMTMLDLGLFLEDGKMPPAQFKNIIHVRLLNGAIDWVAAFIQEWEGKLSNDHGGCSPIYNKAALDFHTGDFNACIRKMEQVLRDFKEDVFYGMDARIYVLMSLYEKGKREDVVAQFESRLNAFRVYLLREKRLGDARKARYTNLVKQFRRLMSLSLEAPDKRVKKAEKFLKILDSLQPASNRKWFVEQVQIFLS